MVRAGLSVTAIAQLSLKLIDAQDLTAVLSVGPVMSRPLELITGSESSLFPVARALINDLVALAADGKALSR